MNTLDEVLCLNGRSASFTRETPLLHFLPELDSMAVVSLLTTFEERLGIVFDDSEISGRVFSTIGTLSDFVAAKTAS